MEVNAFCGGVSATSLNYTLRLLWETLTVGPYQKYQETHSERCYSTTVLSHQQLNTEATIVVVEIHNCTAQIDIL